MLSIQNSPLEKSDLGFVHSITESETHSTNFVLSSEPPVNKVVRPVEVTPPRKIRVDLKESKLIILLFLRIRSMIDLYGFVIFVERLDIFVQIVSSCKL